MCGKELVDRDVEIGTGCSTLVVSLERAQFLSRAIGVDLLSEIFVAKWVTVNGIKYCKNTLVISAKSEDSFPIFELIVYILCMGTKISFITAPWQTVKFDRHTHTYAVQPAVNPIWSVIPVENLYDHQAYHASKSYKGEHLSYVSLRYRIN
jgi:hypothetical protein